MGRPRALNKLDSTAVRQAMAGASSLSAAARALGVDKGTVSRWVAAGKVPAPGGVRARQDVLEAAQTATSPETWAADLRSRYVFTVVETQLVGLAEIALGMARDETQRPAIRLQAMQRFAALVTQLQLPAENEEETRGATQTAVRPVPRRA